MSELELDVIYNEDCLEGMKRLPDKSMGMILCDLPYGITSCEWDTPISLVSLWQQFKRLIVNNRTIAFTASQPFSSILVMSNLSWFRYEWIWVKNRGSNFAVLKYQPMKEHESVLIFSKNSHLYKPVMEKRKGGGKSRIQYRFRPSNTGKRQALGGMNLSADKTKSTQGKLRYPSSVQRFICEVGKHPTQKPVGLFSYLIRTYTDKGDCVLDACIGSGTTAVACKELGRHYIGFEINKEYCAIAEKRLAQGQLALT